MENKLQSLKTNFGTLPVFLTAISTILGAVMFLRFGYAVVSLLLMKAIYFYITYKSHNKMGMARTNKSNVVCKLKRPST